MALWGDVGKQVYPERLKPNAKFPHGFCQGNGNHRWAQPLLKAGQRSINANRAKDQTSWVPLYRVRSVRSKLMHQIRREEPDTNLILSLSLSHTLSV